MCTSPFYLRSERIEVSCGQCLQCRINKRKEWSLRLLHHFTYNNNCVFITLTYNNNNLFNPSLDKRDFQLFMKRLRKCHKNVKFKYFACGEYGDDSFRKHYHAIIYGLSISSYIKDSISHHQFYRKGNLYFSLSLPYWDKGYAIVTGVSEDTISYVCGYVTKKLKGYKQQYDELGLTPPFQLQSQGLGKDYAFDNVERLKSELFCYFKDKKVPIPRYYRKLLDINASYFTEHIFNSKLRTIDMLKKKGKLSFVEETLFQHFNVTPLHILFCREQQNKTLHSKQKMYSRNTI